MNDGFLIKEIKVIIVDEYGIEHEFVPNSETKEQFDNDLYNFMEEHDALDNFDGDVS